MKGSADGILWFRLVNGRLQCSLNGSVWVGDDEE